MEMLRDLTREMQQQSAGLTFARRAIALALGGNVDDILQRAQHRWGANSAAVREIRMAAVPGHSPDDPAVAGVIGTNLGPAEFLSSVRPLELIGKLQPRSVPGNVPINVHAADATAFWTSAGKAAPVCRTTFARHSIRPLRCPVLLIFGNDVLQDASPTVEAMILADMARATIQAADLAFIDRSNTGVTDQIPISITANAPFFPSSGSIADDLAAAVSIFDGDLSAAAWVMHPTIATRIALNFGGASAARLGPRGGELVGLPVVCSQACNFDSSGGVITLVDASGVCVADHGIDLQRSGDALVEMDDAPQGATDTPTGATSHPISLFQADAGGMLVSRRINWLVGRQNAVVCITECIYESGS